MPYLDLSAEQANPPRNDPPKQRIVAGQVVRRAAAAIDTICVHQTAVKFGVTKAQIAASNGDALMAKNRRALQVAAHVTAFDNGYAVQSCPFNWYVYNANQLNSRILGLEIEGSYPGVKKATDAPLFTGLVEAAAQCAIDEMVSRGRALGMPIQFIEAHRQSSIDRRGDPGSEIWIKLVLRYAVPKWGLTVRPDATWGDGRPLPEEWDDPPTVYHAKY